jgi:tetratricopeptide (TPR) repeat protein
LPPELLEKAQLLLEQGSAEQQALAQIALKQHDEANRIIQEIKARPGNAIDEAFRLLTLEGDNWYQAGEYDKALAPYEQAMALRPDDFGARNHFMLSLSFARLGNFADHQGRAIEVGEGTLKIVDPGSADWAETQLNLGSAWLRLPTGNKAENVRKAIEYFEAALTVSTKAADPTLWAATQDSLGIAWSELPTGDKSENLRKAIGCYEAVLTVRTKAAEPTGWADTQYNLGGAWFGLPTGDRAANLRKAIASMRGALRIYTQESFPEYHADAVKMLADLRTAYEVLPAAKDEPFDSIAPAE